MGPAGALVGMATDAVTLRVLERVRAFEEWH